MEELIGFSTSEPNIWVGSAVLEAEIVRNPEPTGGRRGFTRVRQAGRQVDDRIVSRARELHKAAFPNLTRFTYRGPKARRWTSF